MFTATPRVDFIANSSATQENPYETERLLNEYLLFHYGAPNEILPYGDGPVSALGYPERCVTECLDLSALPPGARALDLGCAVGRSSFELARVCESVIGIDYSQQFISAAEKLRTGGALGYFRADEGDLRTALRAQRPEGVSAGKVSFEQGDAMHLREGLGSFDVILMANLIDRLSEPKRCLRQLASMMRAGGQLIITSPYTWMSEYTPKMNWLGGREEEGIRKTTLQGLKESLEGEFRLIQTKDLPFLIREHARKFQWSVAQASIWRRL
jgi:putative 4-mercaptohistidine N1-methyltranferase